MHRKCWSTTMPQDTEQLAGESQATPITILLVEDDPNIGSFLVEAIAQETPYRAIVASDSNAALKLVRHFTPCLFILDYGLPGMNGIELYDRLHINKELAPIPAIKPRHGWWVFRTFDDSGMCLLRGLFLGSLENSFP
jgi:DNA-binding NarL/FixJ family response regulator